MPCAGFSADIYDRYVLGLLEEPERTQLETQIQEQCPECLRGVQRSMNLWLVFATTLENAEPSADFRGRLVRIAELSRKVLTFPKRAASRDRTTILTSTLLVMCAVLAGLLLATWYAGRQSTKLDSQPATAALDGAAQQLANTRVRLQQEINKRQQIEQELSLSGHSAINRTKTLQQQLSEAQAEAQQYKAIIGREQQSAADNTRLITALGSTGARLLPMKGLENAASSVAYAVVIENSKIVFVGADLPPPGEQRQFQLWLLRKEEPKVVSAGAFTPDEDNRAIVSYTEAALVSSISSLTVTNEPQGGSETPTGARVFESSGPED
ncbi:MAG TPA: anti-sigma factor [Bryobacteraceae bacterium]|jgi:anti-sigma-K factor RskA